MASSSLHEVDRACDGVQTVADTGFAESHPKRRRAMATVDPGRPSADEYNPYYDGYIRLVPDGDITSLLEWQIEGTAAALAGFSAEQERWRPAAGEWNITEIVGHLADAERVFSYRALSFARGDSAPLPGMDPDGFMTVACFAERPLADVVEELVAIRRASLALFRSLDAAAWMRWGVADGSLITVRSLAYIMAGHERHHAADFPRHRAMGA